MVEGCHCQRSGAASSSDVRAALAVGWQIIYAALARDDASSFNADRTIRASIDPESIGVALPIDRRGKLLGYKDGYTTTWAGSTALALVAELEYVRATGDNRFAQLRTSWLKGLRVLQVPGRGFREYPGSLEEAAYANGEAWLALATYAVLFPADEYVRAMLSQHDDYVLAKYSAEPDLQFFSWGAMAAAQRFAATSDPRFRDFIAAQASHFVDHNFSGTEALENTCAFVEGLASAAAVLAKYDKYQALLLKLMKRIDREMTKNQALQIPIGIVTLEFHGATFYSMRLPEYAGAYLSGAGNPYARIDITAHCLSALLEIQSVGARQ